MDYEKLIKIRNATNYFANMMDLRIVEIKKGYARTVIDPVTKTHLNPINSIHGGCLFTIGDVTAGSAASSYGVQVTTLNSTFNFLRPGLHTTKLIGEATKLKHGKNISVYTVEIKDQDDTVLAEGTFTFASLGKPIVFHD